MKKKYFKPAIAMESFVLTQTIASCGAKHNSSLGSPTQASKDTCGWQVGAEVVFVSQPICTEELGPEEGFDGICYNNPEGGQSIFNS